MIDTVIRVENLSKLYHIGAAQERNDSLRDALTSLLRRRSSPATRPADTDLWALRDVSFEVKQGEVVGIIGRNGAGKSTLLKILSRITEPTSGRVALHGRVASLLEVGTGFHPELTGRENIYLNGAILGMKRREIERKFDEIVAFAEIERFLDTPVKRYSSGMYVRLAFAVAAHLEPEILLVDEVLAVGDAAFQKKCLGKMGHVAKDGRTVLFVSHNMAAIEQMCSRILAFSNGSLWADGSTSLIRRYLESIINTNDSALDPARSVPSTKNIWLKAVWFADRSGQRVSGAITGHDLVVCIEYEQRSSSGNPDFAFTIYDRLGQAVAYFDTAFAQRPNKYLTSGLGLIKCVIPKFPLVQGEYTLNLLIHRDGDYEDHVASAVQLNVETGDFFRTGRLPPTSYAHTLVNHWWEAESLDRY